MFRTLHSWQYLYIPFTVFMVTLLLYFVRYVHGYMKPSPENANFCAACPNFCAGATVCVRISSFAEAIN